MSFFVPVLNAGIAAFNLGLGINNILQPEYTPWVVALSFGVALFCALLSVATAQRG